MSISREDFDKGNFKKRYNRRSEHPAALFLQKNKDTAFLAKEISKRIKMKENTVRGTLRVLIKKGLVVHKKPYFIWKIKNNKKVIKRKKK